MSMLETVLIAFWTMLPAYIPNNAAVIFGGGKPVDGGREWHGSRLLGDGKTWRGSLGGIATGAALALLLNSVRIPVQDAIGLSLTAFPTAVVVLFPLGAILGDIGASFIKRRTGKERGAAFPGLDQLDFVAGSLVLTALLTTSWVTETFTLEVLAVVLVITPVLHLGTNFIGFKIGLKEEPW